MPLLKDDEKSKNKIRTDKQRYRGQKINNESTIVGQVLTVIYTKMYCKALRDTKTVHYSSLVEESKKNPRFRFSTVSRPTDSHSSIKYDTLVMTAGAFY